MDFVDNTTPRTSLKVTDEFPMLSQDEDEEEKNIPEDYEHEGEECECDLSVTGCQCDGLTGTKSNQEI